MVGCCVPFCGSTYVKKDSSKISLHQFPFDTKLRELWVKNISKAAEKKGSIWSPSDSPELVCALHFTPNDFRKGLKYRQVLKKMAVPTMFTNYLQRMQQMISKEAASENCAGEKNPTEMNTDKDVDTNCKKKNSNADENTEAVTLTKDAATQAQFLFPSKYKTSNNLHNTLQLLKSKKAESKKLTSQIDFLQSQIQTIKNTKSQPSLEKKLLSIIEEAENNNSIGDKVCIELLRTFQDPAHKWSRESLKVCMAFFDESPEGYQFIQELNLIDLPEEKTLMDCAGCTMATEEEVDDEDI